MKNRFFRKSNRIPHSSSVDSQLSQQQSSSRNVYNTANNSIDKPGLSLKPIGESPVLVGSPSSPNNDPTTNHRHHLAILQSSLCQLSPISSNCSSTQGMIGCANELFDANNSRHWDGPKEMKLLAKRKQSLGRRFDVETEPSSSSNNSALVKCQEKKFSQTSTATTFLPSMPSVGGVGPSNGSQQVADLVFTLAQQLSGKDAEIGRLRAQLKKSECRMDRMCREFDRDLERKDGELDSAKEQIGRLKKKLRNFETEMEIMERVNQRIGREDSAFMGEGERKRLLEENDQLKAKLGQEMQISREREANWEKERKELKQSVQSLNGTMEELESEMRQREAREREMQLELERAIVQRDIARMGISGGSNEGQHGQQRMPMLDLPSPKTESDGGTADCCPSSTASSGFGSLLKEMPDQKELEKALGMAKRRLAECRAKIAHLVRAAEKTQRGERLSREDLFGTSLLALASDSLESPKSNSTLSAVEEHIKQIGEIRKDLELLHDKFTILYARGAIGC